ncbi:NAD(P)/FAD-dependent oxidoreductase [soil metagenome]
MNDTDVLIVGAGPTGLTAAISLLSKGAAVTVVDRQPAGANTSRAAAVNARTLEVLDDFDVTRRMVKAGILAPRFTIRDHNRTLITTDFSVLPTQHPYTLLLSQADTEALLMERLFELGGSILRPVELISLRQHDEGVTATFADGVTVHARYVVGADGMHSAVREQAGIDFRGSEYPQAFVLADVRLDGPAPADEVLLYWATAGLTVLAPLPGGLHRVVAPVPAAPEAPSAQFVQQLLDTRCAGPVPMTVTDVVWSSRFRVHHRLADTYRSGRIVLAGDAAHVHSPAGGQGMNLGIQDAVALGDALSSVLAGGSETLLDDYSATRRAIAGQVLALTERLTRLATAPRAVRPVRNVLIALAGRLPAVRRNLAIRLSGLRYR